MEQQAPNIKNLLIAGYLEGISYLLLLGVAMPLKYYADMPIAVKIAGSVHGVLFIWFLLALGRTTAKLKWPLSKAFVGVLASLLPFGPFFLDRYFKK